MFVLLSLILFALVVPLVVLIWGAFAFVEVRVKFTFTARDVIIVVVVITTNMFVHFAMTQQCLSDKVCILQQKLDVRQ